MIIDFPLFGKIELSPEAHARYVANMKTYYEKLPAADQPEEYIDIREEWRERESIQAEAAEALKERRVFTRVSR